jgi:hypothetical protein
VARNIGSIEVTVDTDTGKMTAQLKAAGKKGGKEAAVEIDKALSNINAEIKKINYKKEADLARKGIEAKLRGIHADVELAVDLKEARAVLKEFEEQTEAMRLVLDPSIELSDEDLAAIEKDFRVAKSIVENQTIEVQIQAMLDEAQVQFEKAQAERQLNDMEARAEIEIILREGELARAQAEMDRLEANIEAELDTTQAAVEFARWRMEQGANAVEVDLDLKLSEATAAFDAWRMSMSSQGIDTDVDPDTVRATIAFQRWIEAMEKEDIDVEVKTHETDGGTGLSKRMALIGAAVLALGENLGVALQGALSATVSILSSAIQGLGAAAGAAVPLVVALGTGLAAGIVGAQGFGDALSAVNDEFAAAAAEGRPMNLALLESSEAFRNLSPNASAAASMFAKVRDEVGDLRTVVQDDLFDGMDQEINDLAETVLPSLEDGLRVAAQSVNGFAKDLSAIAQQTDFAGIIQSLDPALDDAFDSAEAFIGSIEPFLKTAAPAAERLADMIERGAEAFEDWTKDAKGQDDLRGFLDDGLTSLQRWMDLLQASGHLLGSIFSAGAESGDSFVISLTNIIERWESWMNDAENADAIQDFFDMGHDAIKAFEPVLDGLKDAFGTLVDEDSMRNLEDFAQAIADMLPAVTSVMAVMADMQLAGAISLVAQGFGVLAEVLNTLPDGMLEFIGMVIVSTKLLGLLPVQAIRAAGALIGMGEAALVSATASAAAATGVGALSAALKLLIVTNAPLLILAATVATVMLAFKIFGDHESDATKRTNELTTALQNNVDAIVSQGDAVNNSSVGMQALTDTLWNTGKGSDKLQESFAEMNRIAGKSVVGVDDVVEIVQSLQGTTDGGAAALTDLGTKMGLTAEDAAALAEVVAGTDDNMGDAESTVSSLGIKMTDLAKKTGIPREELVRMFGALEEVQDQAENTDLGKMTQELLDVASTGTDAEQAMLELAKQQVEAAGLAGDSVALYNAYTTELNKTASAADDASSANNGLASSAILVADAVSDAILAHEAEQAALKETRDKAYDAWQEQGNLARETENAAVQILAAGQNSEGAADNMADGANDVIDFGNAMRDAATEAGSLKSALDLLLNPFLGLQEAEAAVAESSRKLEEQIIGGTEVIGLREKAMDKAIEANEEWAKAKTPEDRARGDELRAEADALLAEADALAATNKTLDLNTEAGDENAAAIRDRISAITDFAEAQLTANVANEEVVATAQASRDALVLQTAAWFTASEAAGTAEQQASNYIDTLGLTPELIETVFSQPDMINALLNAENLTLLYNDAGKPVLTEFEAIGIEITEEQAAGLKTFIESLNGVTGAPTVSAENIDTAAVEGIQTGVDALGETTAAPTVEVPTATTATEAIEGVQTAADTLGDTAVVTTISIPGLQTTIDKVGDLQELLDGLPSTKTIRINVTQSGTIPSEGEFTGGDMAGRLITSEQFTRVGERGLREAIVPLDLPLNRVNPSVRHFAELIRGADIRATTTGAPGKVVNNYMTITPASADPGAVATQVINRAAALANR